MAHVSLRREEATLDDPWLVEGLPGVGLVGKIATDHLVESLDMDYYASVHCEGLPRIGVYQEGDRTLRPPVRLYVSEAANMLALQSDVPISAAAGAEFAPCITGWLAEQGARPLYLSGYPAEKGPEPPALFGVTTGGAGDALDEVGIDRPDETGVVSGPTGALLAQATESEMDAIGLVVESDPQFPDPEAARVVLVDGIAPLTGVETDTDALVKQADDIREQKEQLAKRMQEAAAEESSQAQPLRMYQ